MNRTCASCARSLAAPSSDLQEAVEPLCPACRAGVAIEADPVSIRELEMIFAPGVAPPPLPAAARPRPKIPTNLRKPAPLDAPTKPVVEPMASDAPPYDPDHGRHDMGASDLSAMAALAPPPRRAASVVEPPPPPPRAMKPSEAFIPPPTDSSAEDLRLMAAIAPSTIPPRMARAAPVAKLPPLRPAPPPDEIEEPAPDSSMSDLRRMSQVAVKPAARVDDDMLFLSGGLFGGPVPNAPLLAPDLTAPTLDANAAGADEGVTLAPLTSTTPAEPEAVDRAPAPPVARAAKAAPRGTKTGWLIAAAALAVAGWFAVNRTSGPTAPVAGDTKSSNESATERPILAAPPPVPASPLPPEPSLDDEPPRAQINPADPKRDPSGALVKPEPQVAKEAASPPQPGALPPRVDPAQPKSEPTQAKAEPAPEPAPPPEVAPPPVAPPVEGGPAFDKAAASAALASAAGAATACKKDGDPSGTARVTVTFAPSGRVTSANVNGPPFAGTPTGGCIAVTFRKASVPPFEGAPQPVSKNVTIH